MENLAKIGAYALIAVGIIIVVWAAIAEYRLNRCIRKNITDRVRKTKRTIKI